jgi:signal transduction histidine kinase
MNVPSNLDFATEVKTDRLATLWKVTLAGAVIIVWILLSISMMQRTDVSRWLLSLAALIGGCALTRSLLKSAHYSMAVWSFSIGAVLCLGIAITSGDPNVTQILPFAFPILIFVVGLLLPPSTTLVMAFVATLITVFGPAVTLGGFDFLSAHQFAAVLLTFASALLAAQVTGELYQVTEWALQNYQKERRTGVELFENREALQRSLNRSEALSDRLQETNEALEFARTAAEEAKHFRGQFLANMSHELRTPLNAIIGFSETMLKFPAMYDGVGLPDAYEADLQQIYTSGRQLLGLINDILDLSKVDAGKLEMHMDKVDLKPILNGVLSTAAGLIGERPIKLETDLPEYIPAAWADDARVRQVLLNLYSNAAKFTDRGTISLSVREVEEGIRISVKDTGGGIGPENIDIIFEEFKQAETGRGRDPRSGAGLGLAISRQLLTLMGGRIWAESDLGAGSTFHFVLQPYKEGMTQPARVEPTLVSVDRSMKVIREPEGQEVR